MKSITSLKRYIWTNKQIRKLIKKKLLTVDLKPQNNAKIGNYLDQIDMLIIRTEEAKLRLEKFAD